MVTGDSLLTALHTARECSILGKEEDNKGKDLDCGEHIDDDDDDDVVVVDAGGSDSSYTTLRRRRRRRSTGDTLVLALSNGDGLMGKSSGIRGQGPLDAWSDVTLVWLNSEGEAVFKYSNDCRENREERGGKKAMRVHGVDEGALDHLVGMCARELSIIGGFELATSGNVVVHLSKRSGDCDTGHSSSSNRAMDDLIYFTVSGIECRTCAYHMVQLAVLAHLSLCLSLSPSPHPSPSPSPSLSLYQVFARADPETKSTIVRSFKQAGETVLFCGDGTNDMAALGEADVGVALLTGFNLANTEKPELSAADTEKTEDEEEEEGAQIGDASAAAPFTAKRPSIQSVLGILR
jgi:hypothetical protein